MSTAANKAKDILNLLTDGRDFTLPTIDLSDPDFQFPSAEEMYNSINKLTVEDLTTGDVDGDGVFDKLMTTVAKHVEHEFEENRITGAEYSTTYIAAMQSAMGYGVQFLLSRDASYWQAQQAQLQAIAARVELETAKVRHAMMFIEANTAEANFGLTTLRLANESITYDAGEYNLENTLPQQLTNLQQQEILLREQMEVQRAQTQDQRSDGSSILGSVGKQKELYSQQIDSYQRDSELKAAKVFSDAWTVMKTVDEGLEPPDAFTNTNLQTILNTIKQNNSLG